MKEKLKELEILEDSQKLAAYVYVRDLVNCPDTDLASEYANYFNRFSKWDFVSDVLKGSNENRKSYYFEKYVLRNLEEYIVSAYLRDKGYTAQILNGVGEFVKAENS